MSSSRTDSSSHDRPVIELHGVSLRYRLAKSKVSSFKEYLIHTVRGSLAYSSLWALRDIDLTIHRAETLGIVGRNGAGKSTLLKVISGVLKQSEGERIVRGRISPILELGTGFDPELTGLENIYLNALLRGYRRREIDAVRDSIVEFSGLGEFIHSPVRNYSTGMQARLGFAVATAWVPEVLVLDEVLSVGDASFLTRCHQRIEEFRRAGTTVLVVSHSAGEILSHCTRAVWIDQGRKVAEGPPLEIVGRYSESAGDQATVERVARLASEQDAADSDSGPDPD
ncbi:MAG: ABC transporter ATP-binding protein [Acidobacteriota bacterium]